MVKVNQKRLILFVFAQGVIDETRAGAALLIEHPPLAHAGVHQQADGERQIVFTDKVADRLGAAVLVDREVVLGQVRDDLAVFVADRGKHRHHIRFDRDFGRFLAAQGRAWHQR